MHRLWQIDRSGSRVLAASWAPDANVSKEPVCGDLGVIPASDRSYWTLNNTKVQAAVEAALLARSAARG